MIPALLMTLLAGDALACGGTSPPPTCAKSLVLGKTVTTTFVAGVPTTVPVPVSITLAMTPPAGTPGSSCPLTPDASSITLTATCTLGPGATVTQPLTLTQGLNVATINMPFPAGPPRLCTIVGSVTSTSTLTTGTPLVATAVGDASVCFVEPSVDDPSKPRLELTLVDENNQPVPPDASQTPSHPGDTVERLYRITNHDQTNAVTLDLLADSNQTAGFPDPGFPQTQAAAEGAGVFAISDTGPGDDFPLAFRSSLVCNDCVPLPLDPAASISPTISKTIVLGPGESTVVDIITRSWGMCADGSCGESNVFASGTFSDGSPVSACATGVHVVDDDVPPTFAWPDSGATAAFDTRGSALSMRLQPMPNEFWDVDVLTLDTLVETSSSVSIPGTDAESQLIRGDWGRLRQELNAPLPPGDAWFLQSTYAFDAGQRFAEVQFMEIMPGMPLGFSDLNPMGMGLMNMIDPASGMESVTELFYQLAVWGRAPGGEYVQLPIDDVSLHATANGFVVTAAGVSDVNIDLTDLLLLGDLRAFGRIAVPPVCEEELRFYAADLIPGQPASFVVDGAEPGQSVLLLMSGASGQGPCVRGTCSSLSNPQIPFTLTADAQGVVDFRPRVPPGLRRARLYWEAAVIDADGTVRISPVRTTRILP